MADGFVNAHTMMTGQRIVGATAYLSPGHKDRKVVWFNKNFSCFYNGLIKKTCPLLQTGPIFCGKMLDGGIEKAHKAVRANELATSERATGKEIFPDGKKVLDAGLKMRHKSSSRQRVAPTGSRKKLSRNEKKLVDSENEAA